MRKTIRLIGILMISIILFSALGMETCSKTIDADAIDRSSVDTSINQWMPDKNLQEAVFSALHDLGQSVNENGGYDTSSVDQITPKMLTDLRYLHVDTTNITNLNGLQYATKLIQADFSNNTITELPTDMPGGENLYSLNLGNYSLKASSPDWVLSPKITFKNLVSTYTNLNFGFTGQSISGTYTPTDEVISYSNDKRKATISFNSLFQGFKQADGKYEIVKPSVSIKYSSNEKLTPVVDNDKNQIELDLSQVIPTTKIQIQFSVSASNNGSSYSTWDTLNFVVPEAVTSISDPMAPSEASQVSDIVPLSENNANVVKTRVDALNSFMVNTMMTDTGIYSGYMSKEQKSDANTDNDMFNQITESAGLYLEVLAMRGDPTAFDNYYTQVKKTFSNGDGAFYWMYNTRDKSYKQGNASLDDLRIIRALTMMQGKSPSSARATEIKNLVSGFKKYSLLNGKMIDGTSFTDGTKEPAIRLDYLDMQELKYVYGEGGLSQKDYDDQLKILENAYLGDDFPWYQTYYYYGEMNGYKAGDYSTLPEAKGEVNSIDSLLVILHFAQVGQAKPASINWIKSHVHNRTLYNNYYTNGTPVEKNSAASSYAIAAMIASTVGDKDMYNDCVKDLNDSQVPAGYGDFSGCLGDIPSKKSATYNNLTGLLAYYY
ncbi:hypothetical protein [Lactiplantibacillus pentosus]|uniref:hypothetical protein n=1 Tax=Lactiplantibacillus pentosus TaxID=1589 RepID=UPI0021A4B991|nr:hypothetical protein [Lactiplantibacillus pentosus]MCT3308889.1 hypothetical protein [Lactiplantibacillus pentosus]